MNNKFKSNLEVGERFETEVVLPYLLSFYPDYWIESTHSYKTSKYRGPCIQRTGYKELTLPDFKLYNPANNHQILVEAKFKTSAFSISGHVGYKFVAVEKDKVLEYIEVAKIYRCDLIFAIGCEELNGLYIMSTWVDHYFNNQYYKGTVCAFPLLDQYKVASLF